MATTTNKTAERQHYGEEPTWSNTTDRDSQYCKALNWYHHMSDETDQLNWLTQYMRAESYEAKDIQSVIRTKRAILFPDEIANNDLGINLGIHARILSQGGWIPTKDSIRLKKGVSHLIALGNAIKESKEEKVEDAPTVGVQERIAAQVSKLISDLETVEDCLIRGETPVYPCACANAPADAPVRECACESCGGTKTVDSDLNSWLSKNGCKGVHASRIAEWFRRRMKELDAVLEGTADEQLIEGYSVYKKKQLKNRRDWLKTLIEVCDHQKAVSKQLRAPRRKRQKAPVEVVKNLKFKREDGELKIKSVAASKIVGAEKLVTYNTMTRVCSIFEADSRQGLTVKGTTVLGFDVKKSVCKTLRKPEELLSIVRKDGGIRAIKNAFNASKTTEKQPTGRINEDTILLGVY